MMTEVACQSSSPPGVSFINPRIPSCKCGADIPVLPVLQIHPIQTTVYLLALFSPAVATIFKKKVFDDAKGNLKGKPLDIFVGYLTWIADDK